MILGLAYQGKTVELGLLGPEGYVSTSFGADFETMENLATVVADFLAHHDCAPETLTGIGVSKGPGSYTGLRLSIAVTKTIAQLYNVPIYGLHTLKGTVQQMAVLDGIFAAILPAMKGWFNLGMFSVHQGTTSRLSADVLLKEADLIAQLQKIEEPIAILGQSTPTLDVALSESIHRIQTDCLLQAKTVCQAVVNSQTLGQSSQFKRLVPVYAHDAV